MVMETSYQEILEELVPCLLGTFVELIVLWVVLFFT